VALAPANGVTTKGRPDFKVSGVDPISVDPSVAPVLDIERPELYFSENIDGPNGDGYAIVDTARKEKSAGIDTTYAGEGGVSMKGFFRRFAFYLRFGDLETLTSEYLTSDSKILYVRDVGERVRTIAPFLSFDSDPYPVVVDGRIQFVVDAYTTAATYPYGELADTRQVANSDLADRPLNYVRNSVKAVVDAYDGDVTLYLTDSLYGERDPIARAYAKAFPDLFTSIDEMPAELRAHLRYPEDMFRVQTTMWGRYHQETSEDFYNNSDQWDVAQDPGNDVASASDAAATTVRERIEPYYLQMRLPGQDTEQFVLFRPFVPHSTDDSKTQLTSFMVADSDPEHYGRLQVFTMTQGEGDDRERNRAVDGPLTVNNQMLSDAEAGVSQTITELNRTGGASRVDFGNLLIVPIDEGLLYVRPVYVRIEGARNAPQLQLVIVAIGDEVQQAPTLKGALQKLYPNVAIETQEGGDDDPETPSTGGEEPSTPATGIEAAADLLSQASEKYTEADEALRSGTASALQDYADLNAEARELVDEARTALQGAVVTPAATPDSQPSTTSTTLEGGTTTTTTSPVTTTTGKA
jgi:uncharacterized membrane protein (UPF0182 family)